MRWQVARVRTVTLFCLRALFTSTSWEIASHHLAADTLSAASLGPDIQAQDRSLIMSVPFVVTSEVPKHSLVDGFCVPEHVPSRGLEKNGL